MNVYVTTIQPITHTVKKDKKTVQKDVSFCGIENPVQASKKDYGAKWVNVQIKDRDQDFGSISQRLYDAANSTVVDPKLPLLLCISKNNYYEETPIRPTDDPWVAINDFVNQNFTRR